MRTELSSKDAVESMIYFVRKHLILRDRKELYKKKQPTMTFTGTGITSKDEEVKYALEVVVNIGYSKQALKVDFFDKKIMDKKKEDIYTGLLFPRSVDHTKAKIRFECPYFKQAQLLKTAKDDFILFDKYVNFINNNIKELSRIEWQFAIDNFSGAELAYYNPITRRIEINTIKRLPAGVIIPDNRPLNQNYFWSFADEDDSVLKILQDRKLKKKGLRKEAKIFLGIQQGLHDKIRCFSNNYKIKGAFTLNSNNKKDNLTTRLIPYEQTYKIEQQKMFNSI